MPSRSRPRRRVGPSSGRSANRSASGRASGGADAGAPPPPSAPAATAGTVAGFGARLLAFLVDSVLANAVAVIAGGGFHPGGRHNVTVFAAFLVIEALFVASVGQTPGMRAVGIAVVRVSDGGRMALRWVLVRTVLLAFVLPALIVDGSGRAMHDRAAGAVMVRTR